MKALVLRPSALCACIVFAAISSVAQTPHDPNEGSLASTKPRIPEPMVFDLVRPLGAERGELEINSLFEQPLDGGPLEWAPEVEYTLLDGFGVEFELPIEGSRVTDYKVAVQDTWDGLSGKRTIQGWQSIARIDRKEQFLNLYLLHLAGARFNQWWSMLTMNGLQRENDGVRQGMAFLSNASLFYSRSKHTVYGLESNLKLGGPSGGRWLLMPQMHWRVVDDVNLQVGAGFEKRYEPAAAHPKLGWRLIREF